MKNLASCKPSEFIAQTVKIKKVAAKWVEELDLQAIRNRKQEYKTCPEDASPEERAAIIRANAALEKKYAMENASELFDRAFEKYPEDTLAILALSCFVEPKDVDKHPISEYLGCLTEMMNSKEVLSFFSLLASLKTAQINI